MSRPVEKLDLDSENYLQGEQFSEVRHEYVAGQVYAMTGATEAHNRIAINLGFQLRAAARGTPCGVFLSDMKVRVEASDAFYYPDVVLTCEPQDPRALFKRGPCLIAEVLSDSTELTDRREKLVGYRTLASLQDYLLIAQDRRRVERYHRTEDGRWQHELFEHAGELPIHCGEVALTLTLDDLYEDVALPG